MEEAVPVPPTVVAEAVAAEESTSAATSSSSSLPSGEGGEESGGEAPTNEKKRPAATKKRDTIPGVRRRVVKNIVRDEPKVVEVNADFFVQLGRTLRTVEMESRQRRLSAFSIV